ncbi:MAG: nucleotidyltransferase family protein [Candidatus Nitrosocaldus sp.]|nr:nucleotidyltransferase family protein [Candidatus Nitrosocaldus sp.]MDW8274996.1 nucleotidyltransferase family protein [Candidatus Nitrosocaldus sp.]
MNILRDNMDILKKEFAVTRIGIYGSYTRGDEHAGSDVDIYVEFDMDELTFDKYLGLIEYLEMLLRGRVDLITRDGVRTIRIPYIRESIEKGIIYA